MIMKRLILVLALLSAFASATKWSEADYVLDHCTGEVEVRLEDKTRVDCLTATHAIEYDFAHKWAEAIGQALHYSAMTGRKPGIVIIVDPENKGTRYLARLFSAIGQIPCAPNKAPCIDVWVISGGRI
jgi:hypothetical protein